MTHREICEYIVTNDSCIGTDDFDCAQCPFMETEDCCDKINAAKRWLKDNQEEQQDIEDTNMKDQTSLTDNTTSESAVTCPICGMFYTSGGMHECAQPEPDNVNHPSHYTTGGIECIDAIKEALSPEEFRGYIKGNVMKYIWREQHKNGDEDLRKAAWYLNKLVDGLPE